MSAWRLSDQRFGHKSQSRLRGRRSAFTRDNRVNPTSIQILTEFDIPDQAKQDVVALDITMDNTMPMEMLKTLARLATHSGNLAFGHEIRGDHIRQAAALHILHDDPEVILPQETIDIVDDIRMAGGTHDENLIDDEIFLRLLVEVHLLDGDGHVGADLVGGVHASTGPLTNFDEVAIEAGRISIGTNSLETLDNVLSIRGIFLPLPPAWGSLGGGLLDLEFGHSRRRTSSSPCTTGRGTLARTGSLASGGSRRGAGGLRDTRGRGGSSGVRGAPIVLGGAGAFNVRDTRVALAMCL